jgi:hypothetical protein
VRAVIAILCVGSLVTFLGIGLALSARAPRQAGSNFLGDALFVKQLRPRDRLCQRPEVIPGGAAALRLRVTAVRGQPTTLELTAWLRDVAVTAGRATTPASGGHVVVPIRRVPRTVAKSRVCVVNSGMAAVNLDGGKRRVSASKRFVRFEWLRTGRESWVELTPIITKRFAWGKANPLGTLLLPAVLVLVAGLWVAGAVVAWDAVRQ